MKRLFDIRVERICIALILMGYVSIAAAAPESNKSSVETSYISGSFSMNIDNAFIIENTTLDGFPNQAYVKSVDFRNRTVKTIYKEREIYNIVANPSNSRFMFTGEGKKTPRRVHVYDRTQDRITWSARGTTPLGWSDNGEVVAYGGGKRGSDRPYYYEYNLSTEKSIDFMFQGDILSIKWNDACQCFYYLVIPYSDEARNMNVLSSQVIHYKDGKLHKEKFDIKKHRYFLESPDGNYYFTFESLYEVGNSARFYNKEGKLLYSGDYGAVNVTYQMLWNNGHVYRFPSGGGYMLDLKEKKAFVPAIGINGSKMKDVAIDHSGFVLLYDKTKKDFAVLDVAKMKIIKRYQKFWK